MSSLLQRRSISRITAERQRQDLSLRELGALAGIHFQKINLIERGLAPLYPAYARRLATALGIAEDELLQVVRVPTTRTKRGGRR